MIRPFIMAAALAAVTALSSFSGHASERPRLRGDITVEKDLATIGDFFQNAGHLALTPLFQTPDLGRSGTVSAAFVIERAMASGLANPDSNGFADVIVRRASVQITPQMFTEMLRDALAERIGVADPDSLDLHFASRLPQEDADPTAPVPLYLEELHFASRSGRFDARFSIRQGRRDKTVSIAGSAAETVEVAVLTRRLSRGETVTRRDLATKRIPRNLLNENSITDLNNIVGLVARRGQAADRPLASRDFQAPLMVKRREKVIITYSTPGMFLTVQGQALEDGAEGDTVEILNTQSHRRIEATVTGPGRVTVVTGNSRVASLKEALK